MRNKSPKCRAIQQLFEKLLPSCLNTRHRVPNHAITKSGQVCNYATKKPAPEYPEAGVTWALVHPATCQGQCRAA